MTEQTLKQYGAMLEKGGLVSREQLQAAVAELAPGAAREISVDELTAHLIARKLITPWHAEKLKAGRYRGFFLGKYKLLTLLGSGGMCSVYLAEHQILRQLRAIKVLPRNRVADKSYLDRFYREGRAAAALNHPNIVRVYDIDHEGETHYLVMEYVEGWNLYDYVKQHGPLEFGVALDYLLQAAVGLQHAHELGLVHRDVKPANLLITETNVLKISDLGLALFREEDYSLTMAHNERVLGTADYLAPEQAVNSHNVDHRADIYGLGCSLYYLLSGSPPFPTGSLAQRIAMHQSAEPTSLRTLRPDCPPEIAQLCERMMKKSPADRFQDCRELQQELQRLQTRWKPPGGAGGAAKVTTTATPPAAPPAAKSTVKKADAAAASRRIPAAGGGAEQTAVTSSGSSTRRVPPAAPRTAATPPANPAATARTAAERTPTAAVVAHPSSPSSGRIPAAASPAAGPKSNVGSPAPAAGHSAAGSAAPRATKPAAPAASRPIAVPAMAPPESPALPATEMGGIPRVRVTNRRRAAQRQQWILIGVIAGLAVLLVLVMILAFRLTVRTSHQSGESPGPGRPELALRERPTLPMPGDLLGFSGSPALGRVQPPAGTI